MTDLPAEIQIWESNPELHHTGTWATTRYPAEAVTYVRKADAKAAQAMVVERAAELCDRVAAGYEAAGDAAIGCGVRLTGANIRALADTDGEALVRELREERDALETAREMLGGFWAEAIADRDRLSAANAALEAKVARLVGALKPFASVVKQMSQNHLNIEDDDLLKISGKDLLRAYDTLAEVQARDKGEGGE